MSRPLLLSLTTPSDVVLCVADGRAWALVGSRWVELRDGYVTSLGAAGIGGSVMNSTQAGALTARVGLPR